MVNLSCKPVVLFTWPGELVFSQLFLHGAFIILMVKNLNINPFTLLLALKEEQGDGLLMENGLKNFKAPYCFPDTS